MDFGFKIARSSAINMDEFDSAKWKSLREVAPDAGICMACGSCSATCTSGPYSGMSLRKVLLNLQRGLEKDAEKLVKSCMLCGKCTMVCPRGINTRQVILGIWRTYGKDANSEKEVNNG